MGGEASKKGFKEIGQERKKRDPIRIKKSSKTPMVKNRSLIEITEK